MDAPAVEETNEQIFAEIKTADGELTLSYEGEGLEVGKEIMLITPDGMMAIPDGTYALEGGVSIEAMGGMISEIADAIAEEEEAEDEVIIEEEMSEESVESQEMSEETEESTEEEFSSEEPTIDAEAFIADFAEVMKPTLDALRADIDSLRDEFAKTTEKVETFSAAPSAEKTIPTVAKRSNKADLDFKPLTEAKQKQFERLVNRRKKQ